MISLASLVGKLSSTQKDIYRAAKAVYKRGTRSHKADAYTERENGCTPAQVSRFNTIIKGPIVGEIKATKQPEPTETTGIGYKLSQPWPVCANSKNKRATQVHNEINVADLLRKALGRDRSLSGSILTFCRIHL